jgi:hypothetical protein
MADLNFDPQQIQEFSTGIGVEFSTDNKTWRSTGYTGRWRNNTFVEVNRNQYALGAEEIPEPIDQAIKNKEFEVGEGDRSKGAIVGRIVQRQGYREVWSVLVVISGGGDNRGRYLPLYRYFCYAATSPDQGKEFLLRLTECTQNYHDTYNQWPIFDPYDLSQREQLQLPNDGQHQQWNSQRSETLIDLLQKQDARMTDQRVKTVVLEPQVCQSPYQLHALAASKAYLLGYPIAWAYNVEAVSRPESFVAMQVASAKAYQQFGGFSYASNQQFIHGSDQAGLKSAIKQLGENHRVTTGAMQQLDQVWQDEQLREPAVLESIFQELGLRSLLFQGNTHPTLVRQFTLRTILIPGTFKEYLTWCSQHPLESQPIKVSLQFQSEFSDHLSQYPTLSDSLGEDFVPAVLDLLQGQISGEHLAEFLSNPQSFWANTDFLTSFSQSLQTVVDDAKAVQNRESIDLNSPLKKEERWQPLFRYVNQRSQINWNYFAFELYKRQTPYPQRLFSFKSLQREVNHYDEKREMLNQAERNLPQPCQNYQSLAQLLDRLDKSKPGLFKNQAQFLTGVSQPVISQSRIAELRYQLHFESVSHSLLWVAVWATTILSLWQLAHFAIDILWDFLKILWDFLKILWDFLKKIIFGEHISIILVCLILFVLVKGYVSQSMKKSGNYTTQARSRTTKRQINQQTAKQSQNTVLPTLSITILNFFKKGFNAKEVEDNLIFLINNDPVSCNNDTKFYQAIDQTLFYACEAKEKSRLKFIQTLNTYQKEHKEILINDIFYARACFLKIILCPKQQEDFIEFVRYISNVNNPTYLKKVNDTITALQEKFLKFLSGENKSRSNKHLNLPDQLNSIDDKVTHSFVTNLFTMAYQKDTYKPVMDLLCSSSGFLSPSRIVKLLSEHLKRHQSDQSSTTSVWQDLIDLGRKLNQSYEPLSNLFKDLGARCNQSSEDQAIQMKFQQLYCLFSSKDLNAEVLNRIVQNNLNETSDHVLRIYLNAFADLNENMGDGVDGEVTIDGQPESNRSFPPDSKLQQNPTMVNKS